jgi:hypothetical protein
MLLLCHELESGEILLLFKKKNRCYVQYTYSYVIIIIIIN